MVLKKAKKLDLGLRCEFPDLVDEQSTSVSEFEPSLTRRNGTGKGSPFMSEQLALQDSLGQCTAINDDERSVLSVAVIVDRPGDQLLPRSAFTSYENGSPGRCNAQGQVHHIPHPAGHTDDALRIVLSLYFGQEQIPLDKEPLPFKGLADHDLELIHGKGLGYVVMGTKFHGLHCRFDRGVCSDHQDRNLGIVFSYMLEKFDPVHSGHVDIGDDQIPVLVRKGLESFASIGARCGSVALLLHYTSEQAPHPRFIIHNKHFLTHIKVPLSSITAIPGNEVLPPIRHHRESSTRPGWGAQINDR